MEASVYAVVVMFGANEHVPDGEHPRFLAFCEHEDDAIRWAEFARSLRREQEVEVCELHVYSTDDVDAFLAGD